MCCNLILYLDVSFVGMSWSMINSVFGWVVGISFMGTVLKDGLKLKSIVPIVKGILSRRINSRN